MLCLISKCCLCSGEIYLRMRVKEVMKTSSHHWTHLWERLVDTTHAASLFQKEQDLCRCSGFIYLRMEPLLANVPPAKLAAFNLPECSMVLLFDRVLNKTNVLHQTNLERKPR
ncbi:cilia- and flagella-associated protein 46-like [Nothobranchius furzeri]|uniref:cilia- and flagella-associated protein 46-like n=1 Tax=Nothobranchius furzeri TaxID=105023 RepID=UPI0039049053